MLIIKTYKFRMYPNDLQLELINKTIGCARLVYNYFLNKKQILYKDSKINLSSFDMIKELPRLYKEYPFLKEVDSCSLRCALFDLDNTYQKLFKEHAGYPKYKSKYSDSNTYRTNYITSTYKGKKYNNIELNLENKQVKLPKIGLVNIKGYRNKRTLKGRIINTTIERAKTNKYYISIVVEEENTNEIITPKSIIGLDLGIKELIVTSSNERYPNEQAINKYENRIKKAQKALARKTKGSNNYYKNKQKIAILYSKLTNARKYLIHKITSKIVKENDIIVTEKLKIKEMIKNHNLAKQITNASFNEITRQLEYKAKWLHKKFYQIETYYPSSQICSVCDYKNTITKNINVRYYTCPNCSNELDRDLNASINIMFEGLKKYMKELVCNS